jgi:hypothetical protein
MLTRNVLVIALLAPFLACSEDATEPPPDGDDDTLGSVDLQPDRDNTLYEDSAGQLSNGAGQFVFAGLTNQPQARRAALHFDVAGSQIPAGSTIDSVTLTLHMSRTAGGAATVSLHRFTTAWGEAGSNSPGAEGTGTVPESGDATWIHTFFDTGQWSNAGGDFVTAATASTVVQGTGFYTWASSADMVSDIQDWLDNPASNFGWIVIGDETTPVTAKRFDSRENDVVENRPSLTIFYTRP